MEDKIIVISSKSNFMTVDFYDLKEDRSLVKEVLVALKEDDMSPLILIYKGDLIKVEYRNSTFNVIEGEISLGEKEEIEKFLNDENQTI